jgi:ABC-2 type transport system permease protein
MKSLIAFLKKEIVESIRTGKVIILGGLFILFGIMNPAIAKLTPWLFEILSNSLTESGMIVTEVKVDALTSWTQFFKNIPMALIAFVLIYSTSFTKEYESNSLVIILTKGLKRYKVLLSKLLTMLIMWTLGYFVCFIITYLYNDYFWDNNIANNLLLAVMNWWLFGVFVICMLVLTSTITNNSSSVLLGTGVLVLVLYLIGLLPKATYFMPTTLMSSAPLLINSVSTEEFIKTIVITVLISLGSIIVSISSFNKKQL